jgi:Lar family restriction alleviation protein
MAWSEKARAEAARAVDMLDHRKASSMDELTRMISDAALDAAAAVDGDAVEDDDKLRPCPFCGGKAEEIYIEEEGDNFGGSCICCKTCGASSAVHFDRKENLRSSWNARRGDYAALNAPATQISDDVRALLDEAIAALEKIDKFEISGLDSMVNQVFRLKNIARNALGRIR